ncbi:hypothetical protein VTO73DRAFT_10623 [Trametes versicolor]
MASLRSTEDAAYPLRNLEGEASYAPENDVLRAMSWVARALDAHHYLSLLTSLACGMVQPALPIEIIEWIIDFMLEEVKSGAWAIMLMDCSLVCRAWLPRCRFHLFKRRWLPLLANAPMRVYQLREVFDARPHLCKYVQQFNLAEVHPLLGRPLYPIFLTVLAPYFPLLRELEIGGLTTPLYCHRMFRAPAFKAPTITSLHMKNLVQREWTNIYDVLSLFPNLHDLTFADIVWPEIREDGSIAKILPLRPRQISLLPPIARLAIATSEMRINVYTEPLPTLSSQLGGLMTLLHTFANTLTYLKINIGTFSYFTHPNLHRHCTTTLDLPNLEEFDVYLRGPRGGLVKESYAARVARVPKVLRALRAKKLRIVSVHISQFELYKWKTLDGLAALNDELEELFDQSHFPRLMKIRFDVDSTFAGRYWWDEQFAEIFPRLWKSSVIENVVCILPSADLSLFADYYDPKDWKIQDDVGPQATEELRSQGERKE